jgi:plastocyanin
MTRTLVAAPASLALVLSLSGSHVFANPGNQDSVTVAFGAGLNTAQPGNAANHHVVPARIKVKAGGVVNFAVAGFHQIYVYLPGRAAEDIVVPGAGLFVNDLTGLYYAGLSPVGAAPEGFSNAMNRVESVSFSEPGVYLVICNVRGHFLDGMYAYVEVTG